MYTLTPETDKPLPHVNPVFPTSPLFTNNRQEPDFSENAVDASPSGSIWAIVLTLVASALNGQRLRLARRGPLEQCWLLTNYRLSTINSSCLASHWLIGHWHQPCPATKFSDYLLIQIIPRPCLTMGNLTTLSPVLKKALVTLSLPR